MVPEVGSHGRGSAGEAEDIDSGHGCGGGGINEDLSEREQPWYIR